MRSSQGLWCSLALWLSLTGTATSAVATPCTSVDWPGWVEFKTHYLSDDGRVIDPSSTRHHTVSEGQAYALFFALVANDRAAFDRILQWTENNLAQGDLTAHLPAWVWGQRDDGSWGVLDANPASDADVWIAYTLGEAAQLWQDRRLRILSAVLGKRILAEETEDLPGLGPTLLPGPAGFHLGDGRWRLNPSYLPLQVLRGLARQRPESGWQALLPGSEALLTAAAPMGFAPDWIEYQRDKGFLPDQQNQALGDYDAIRVYLWAGMLDPADPARANLLRLLRPMAETVARQGTPPETVDTRDGSLSGEGGAGFSAALLPFLSALKMPTVLDSQRARIPVALRDNAYYESTLILFGLGWLEQRFRFDVAGNLQPAWQRPCKK